MAEMIALAAVTKQFAGKTELQVTAGEPGFPEEVLEKVQGASSVRVAVPVIEAVVETHLKGQGNLLILGVDMTGDRTLRDYDLDSGDEAVIDDPAIAQRDGAFAALRDLQVVRDDDHGAAEAPMDVADQREDLFARARVEVAGRFVGEEHRRVDRERAGDGDALALTAGEFVGQVGQAAIELDEGQEFARAFVDSLARPAAEMQRQADVFDAGQRRQQVEELEDEADPRPP